MIIGINEGLFSIPVATAPIINNGPDVLEKQTILSASTFDTSLSCLKSETILGPNGYPETMLIANEKAPTPGTLKRIFTKGSKSFPIKLTKPMSIRISDIIKKGNSDGTTILNQVFRPLEALFKETLGYFTIANKTQSISIKNKILEKDFFIKQRPPICYINTVILTLFIFL